MKEETKIKTGRRDFLRAMGAGAGVAAIAPLASPARADNESNEEKRKTRYRDSKHIEEFYRVNRYPNAK